MSALRINPPGQPIRHIDLGPAAALRGYGSHHITYGSFGGPIEQQASSWAQAAKLRPQNQPKAPK